MIAEIISVGTEIIIGSILNTNTKFLSERLLELGIETFYHSSVDDNEERLTNVINIALSRADIIITTGGLGPTDDDLTKEVFSKTLGLTLELDPFMEEHIRDMFKATHRTMTTNNLKQAIKPIGSYFITNNNGTAPGIFINKDNKKIVLLPGPPRELEPMFDKFVVDLIRDDYTIISKSINTIGIGESSLESQLKTLDIYKKNFEIATFAKEGEVEIKIIGKGKDRSEVEMEIDNIVLKIKDKIKDYIYGYDNIQIEELLVNSLIKKDITVAICESCTGGLITSRIIRIPGASNVIDRGLITYSNKSKIEELSVNPSTLSSHGAVSEETAYEMAKGLLDKTGVDVVLSITGIAGPSGGTLDKPVGLVYIGIMSKDKYKIIKNIFTGNRSTLQNRAATRALVELYRFL